MTVGAYGRRRSLAAKSTSQPGGSKYRGAFGYMWRVGESVKTAYSSVRDIFSRLGFSKTDSDLNELKQKIASLEREVGQIKKKRDSGRLATKGKALMNAFTSLETFSLELTPSKKLIQSIESTAYTESPVTEKSDSESEADGSIATVVGAGNSTSSALVALTLLNPIDSTNKGVENVDGSIGGADARRGKPALSFSATDLKAVSLKRKAVGKNDSNDTAATTAVAAPTRERKTPGSHRKKNTAVAAAGAVSSVSDVSTGDTDAADVRVPRRATLAFNAADLNSVRLKKGAASSSNNSASSGSEGRTVTETTSSTTGTRRVGPFTSAPGPFTSLPNRAPGPFTSLPNSAAPVVSQKPVAAVSRGFSVADIANVKLKKTSSDQSRGQDQGQTALPSSSSASTLGTTTLRRSSRGGGSNGKIAKKTKKYDSGPSSEQELNLVSGNTQQTSSSSSQQQHQQPQQQSSSSMNMNSLKGLLEQALDAKFKRAKRESLVRSPECTPSEW